MHIPQAAVSLCTDSYINLCVVSSPLSMILSCHSQSHTVFPSPQTSYLPTDPLEQRHIRKRENESEKVTKFCIYIFVPLDVYKTETALIKALLSSLNKEEEKCLLANIKLICNFYCHRSHRGYSMIILGRGCWETGIQWVIIYTHFTYNFLWNSLFSCSLQGIQPGKISELILHIGQSQQTTLTPLKVALNVKVAWPDFLETSTQPLWPRSTLCE